MKADNNRFNSYSLCQGDSIFCLFLYFVFNTLCLQRVLKNCIDFNSNNVFHQKS